MMSRAILFGCLIWMSASTALASVVQLDSGYLSTPKADVSVTGTATLIAAANAARASMSCTNTHATVHVRWGSSAVTATTGQQLRATASIEIKNIGAIYMISEGASVTVSCTEETR